MRLFARRFRAEFDPAKGLTLISRPAPAVLGLAVIGVLASIAAGIAGIVHDWTWLLLVAFLGFLPMMLAFVAWRQWQNAVIAPRSAPGGGAIDYRLAIFRGHIGGGEFSDVVVRVSEYSPRRGRTRRYTTLCALRIEAGETLLRPVFAFEHGQWHGGAGDDYAALRGQLRALGYGGG